MNTTTEEPTYYSFSHNEEDYHGKYATREEAAHAGFEDDAYLLDEEEPVTEVWTGECVIPDRTPDADALIEQVAMHTTEECGEYGEDFLAHVSKEARKDLQDRLQALWDEWEEKWNEKPTFYTVQNVERHERPTP